MEYNLNRSESVLFLSYMCYGTDGFDKREASNFINTVREFLENPDDFDNEYYFAVFDDLIESNEIFDLITMALKQIDSSLYKKVLVYIMEGVVSDGNITDSESILMKEIAEQMKVDIYFYQKALEVLIEKYL